jgi:hypothetical protein
MFRFFKILFAKKTDEEILREKYSYLVDNRFWDFYEIFKIYNIVDYRFVVKKGNEEYLYIKFDDPSDTVFICIRRFLNVVQGSSVIYSKDVGVFSKYYDKIVGGKLPDFKVFLGDIFSEKIKVYLLEKSF